MVESKRVIALGFFDGVHLGHAALLERAVERAAEQKAIPSVLSFDTHPDTLVFGKEVPLLNSNRGREQLIRRLFGIDDVILLHFDRRMMEMPWNKFLDSILRELRVCWVVAGHDFCFGHRGEGTPDKLRGYCLEHGVGCDIIPAVKVDGRVVSSTYIRELIRQGNMEEAQRFLGHPHTLEDTVHSGYHLGTKMGVPTINMRFPPEVLVPRHGVYATHVYLENGEAYRAVTNVGVRPTVSRDEQVSVESHLLNYTGDLYGRRARVEFARFLREERRFDSLQELSEQIQADAQAAERYFAAC